MHPTFGRIPSLKKHQKTYLVWKAQKTHLNIPDFSCFSFLHILLSYLAITCTKLTIETPEQRCEICSKLTIKPPKRCHWRRFGGFIVNFEHILHLSCSVSNVDFEQVNAGWDDPSSVLLVWVAFLPWHIVINVFQVPTR